MTVHILKVLPKYFQALVDGTKTFEVRRNDRAYQVGDILHLGEWAPEEGRFTGRSVAVKVTYILDDPQFVPQVYVILGIKPVATTLPPVHSTEEVIKQPEEDISETVICIPEESVMIIAHDEGDKPVVVDVRELRWRPGDGVRAWLTLRDIQRQLMRRGYHTVYYVWTELGLSGEIYQYGNNGPHWELHGKTRGYA